MPRAGKGSENAHRAHKRPALACLVLHVIAVRLPTYWVDVRCGWGAFFFLFPTHVCKCVHTVHCVDLMRR